MRAEIWQSNCLADAMAIMGFSVVAKISSPPAVIPMFRYSKMLSFTGDFVGEAELASSKARSSRVRGAMKTLVPID